MTGNITGKCIYIFICTILVCIAGSVHSQTLTTPSDTSKVPAKKTSTKFVTEDDINKNIALHYLDTNPDGIEIFHNLYKNYIVFQDLGNIGTPSRSLVFNPERPVGFRLGENPFAGYWMKPENSRFYNTKTPYTDLFYAQGSNELIYLLARHSQNILPRWNIGADLQRITSIGFFARQYTSIYNFQFFTRYTSKNKKYDLLAHATWNRGLVEESGGIQNDSAFESLTGANKKVTPNLASSQTRFKARTAYLKQYWHFGKLEQTINDKDTIYDLNTVSHISYSIKAEEESYIFENQQGDTNSLLIPHQYYDVTVNTFDSTYYGKLENRVDFCAYNSSQAQLKDSVRRYMNIGFSHSLISVSQNPYVRNYHNTLIDFNFEVNKLKNNTTSLFWHISYNMTGYNQGDYKLEYALRNRRRAVDIGFRFVRQSYKPDYMMLVNKSNQFIWNNENTFGKTQVDNLKIYLNTRRFRHNFNLSANIFVLQNWVYANSDGIPVQDKDKIQVARIELNKTFQFWKLYFEHIIIYQKSDKDVIRLPDASGLARYYFQSRFKKMRFQIGVDILYNTAYYANNYNPASRLFFLQDSRLVGNYPLIEPFFAGEVKRAIFFAKYEHVNQDLFSINGYYYTPHNPISLSSLRFGIRWRFYD